MAEIMRAGLLVAVFSVNASLACAAAPADFGKHDTKLPIEITADTLEVLQQENKAIFRGNVLAVQGKMHLKSDAMTVHYRQNASHAGQQHEAISRIDVDGHVFMSTPEETASAVQGLYDVDNQRIELHQDVVLTREQNILKGDSLDYNLTTGRSVVSGPQQTSGGVKRQRVRGLFVPKEAPKPGGEKQP